MELAYRGIVDEYGDVHGWPTALMTHKQAFAAAPVLQDITTVCWRQWWPGEAVDFDPGTSAEDKAKVNAWVAKITNEEA